MCCKVLIKSCSRKVFIVETELPSNMVSNAKFKISIFDIDLVDGICFLDGDLLARQIGYLDAKGHKYPSLEFENRYYLLELDRAHCPNLIKLHLFRNMYLPVRTTCIQAYRFAYQIAKKYDYTVETRMNNQLEIRGFRHEHFLVSYDNTIPQISDIKNSLDHR